MDRGDHGNHRRGHSEPQHHAPEPDTYYIIPPGTNVIFQDEDGNEIHRQVVIVGDFTGKKRHYKEQPIVVQDEFGREIYRTPGYGEPRDNISYMDHYGNTPNIILMDRQGRQIPM
ncbi:hypothetical protein FIBSPDRAFT_1012939 [Athelia psychrophila]|uniref:Uncharacterized protein n=1 Tax=Athelia psychrophila TaxID=1759441 RepID=A0A166VNI6_9AGAM|nr:hypothetical protein FIBSPDRAFT_1012939 [Fibularhizoctonia sp. CBS 109695]